ncbi:uncharacterized protein [Penaeus vannamei]|uniref:uncharacterized protein n=1 Tax=Penaeus vannamei TaxID=6689 RepID=UPI00387FA556
MVLDQINSLAMNCDLKATMDLEPGDPQGGTALYAVCGKKRDSIFASPEEDEFIRLAGLSSAPLYAFDEDGDILPQSHPFTPHNSVGSAFDMSPSTPQPGGTEGDDIDDGANVFDTPGDSQDAAPSFAGGVAEKEIWLIDDENGIADDARPPAPPLRRRPSSLEEEQEVFGVKGLAEDPQEAEGLKEQEKEEKEEVEDGLKMGTSARAKGVPTIDLHAASIEVVEDYLEDDTGDDRLRDCCSMVVSHPGGPNCRTRPPPGGLMTYLSASPAPDAPPRRSRVPFHTVVFTERKPSTGDALIRSLGLAAPGVSSSIQDIASVNQDAARERLHLEEHRWMHQCTSCGVSPEECLEKLGLNPNHAKSLNLYPKSERLWQFLHQVQTKLSRPRPPRTPSYPGPLPDTPPDASPDHAHHRSLANTPPCSPTEDPRQPRLNTY